MIYMKKTLLIIAVASIVFACNTEKTPENASSPEAAVAPKLNLPYVPSYSSSFELGNPAYAEMVVQGSWKDWEENNLDNIANWAADTIMAVHSNMQITNGVDSLIARWKRGRAEYIEVKPTINAVLSVHSTDMDEDWVLIWATEIDTKKDGTIDTVALMESWRINKAGKADMLLQFDRNQRKK